MPSETHLCKIPQIFLFFLYSCAYSTAEHDFCYRIPPKLRSKTTVESPDSRSDDEKASHEGRVPTLVEQIKNLMNFLVRQQENPSNNPIKKVEGRGSGNVDVSILFSNSFNEFHALIQDIMSQRVIMTAFME